jgi:hypothetical protein
MSYIEDYVGIYLLNKLIINYKLDTKTLTLNELLKVIIQKKSEILIKPLNIDDIKYENIIYANSTYYRRSSVGINGNKIKVKQTFLIAEDKLLYNIPATEPELELELDINKVKIIGLPIIELKYNQSKRILECNGKICEIKRINHGTPFRQLKESEYAPYNIFGNWFTGLNKTQYDENKKNKSLSDDDAELLTLGGESVTYTTEFTTVGQLPNYPGYLYEYNIKKETQLLKMDKSKDIEYLILIFMFFDIQLRNYTKQPDGNGYRIVVDDTTNPVDKSKDYCIAYHENNTVRDATSKIGKYNYTQLRNNIDPTNLSLPQFNPGIWDVIRSETADDGDKALAVRFCTNFNQTKNPLHLNLAGWLVRDIYYFMLCNPKDLLKNNGVYILLKEEIFGKDTINILIDKLKSLKSPLFEIVTIAQGTKSIYVKRENYEEFNKIIALQFPKLKIEVFEDFKKSIMGNNITKINEQIPNIFESICDIIRDNLKKYGLNFDRLGPLHNESISQNFRKLEMRDLISFLINVDTTDKVVAIKLIKDKIQQLWTSPQKIDVSFDDYLYDQCKNIKEISNLIREYLNGNKQLSVLNVELNPLLINFYKFLIYSLIIYSLIIRNSQYTLSQIDSINTPKDIYNELIKTHISIDIDTLLKKDIISRALLNIDTTEIIKKSVIQNLQDNFIQLGGENNDYYKEKYLKYKQKYLRLKIINK